MSDTKLIDNKKPPVNTMNVDDDPTVFQDQVKTFPLSYLINSLHILCYAIT